MKSGASQKKKDVDKTMHLQREERRWPAGKETGTGRTEGHSYKCLGAHVEDGEDELDWFCRYEELS